MARDPWWCRAPPPRGSSWSGLDPAYSGTGEEIANQGSVAAGTPDPRPANNTGPRPGAGLPGGSVTGPTADLAITKKHAATGPAGPGETFDYLLTVVNHGPSEAAQGGGGRPPAARPGLVSSADGCTGRPTPTAPSCPARSRTAWRRTPPRPTPSRCGSIRTTGATVRTWSTGPP
ncbi:hypothetical protein GCM10020229_72340 [Kitasatospora albolonga]